MPTTPQHCPGFTSLKNLKSFMSSALRAAPKRKSFPMNSTGRINVTNAVRKSILHSVLWKGEPGQRNPRKARLAKLRLLTMSKKWSVDQSRSCGTKKHAGFRLTGQSAKKG